jgi:hypothetical protein
MAEEFDFQEMDVVYEKMRRMSQYTDETIAQLKVRMETEWTSQTARTVTQWQEAIRLLHQIAEASGLDVQKIRQEITDERYWGHWLGSIAKPYPVN